MDDDLIVGIIKEVGQLLTRSIVVLTNAFARDRCFYFYQTTTVNDLSKPTVKDLLTFAAV